MNEQATMTLASGWRFLTPEEYAQLGPLADDPSVRLVAVAKTKDEGNVPTFVVTGGALNTDASDDEVYADSVRQVEEALPGFHLIDDFAWPVAPHGARWRTGVYILENVSLTLSPRHSNLRSVSCGPRRVRALVSYPQPSSMISSRWLKPWR